MKTAVVLGAGGFIGSHLVKRLKKDGYWVRGVDLKYPEFSDSEADDFVKRDLRDNKNVESVLRLQVADFNGQDLPLPFSYLPREFVSQKTFDEVYQLAADMGGCQFVFGGDHDADIMHNSALINLNVCEWSVKYGVKKVFYSSSACMYPKELQGEISEIDITGYGDYDDINYSLKEEYAYPANPDSEYGWEKLFSERLYLAYARNYGLDVRIARFHNIYGPEGTYKGGREKAPASISYKVASNDLRMWGDGSQTRSFLYIDDCIDAVMLLMKSDFKEPINIGSEEMVSIKTLWEMIIVISGNHKGIIEIEMPGNFLGVRGRNSNNTLIREKLNWEPKYSLKEGLSELYSWVKSKYENSNG